MATGLILSSFLLLLSLSEAQRSYSNYNYDRHYPPSPQVEFMYGKSTRSLRIFMLTFSCVCFKFSTQLQLPAQCKPDYHEKIERRVVCF